MRSSSPLYLERAWTDEDELLCVNILAVALLLIFLIVASLFRPLPRCDCAEPDSSDDAVPKSPLRIWALTAMNIPFGFSVAIMGLLLAPMEARRLWQQNSSRGMGIIAALAGVAQLLAPYAGYCSDTYRSGLGRRRPMLLMSVAMFCAFSLGMWHCSLVQSPVGFAVHLLLQQMSQSVMLSVQLGLVADLIPKTQQEIAGAAGATNMLIGAVAGCVYMHMASELDYHKAYAMMTVMLPVCFLVCLVSDEKPSVNMDFHSLHISELYTFDIRAYPDFFMLLVTKTIYCSSVVVKAFLLLFLQDKFRFSHSWTEAMASKIAITGELSAALAALCLFMRDCALTEFTASTRRCLHYLRIGATLMALLWWCPVILALDTNKGNLHDGEFASQTVRRMQISVAVWGIAHGLYMVGDQAVTLMLLPDRTQTGRYLGFGSICACLGTLLGAGIFSGLLEFFGSGTDSGYTSKGYVALFAGASILSFAITLVSSYINLPEKENTQIS